MLDLRRGRDVRGLEPLADFYESGLVRAATAVRRRRIWLNRAEITE